MMILRKLYEIGQKGYDHSEHRCNSIYAIDAFLNIVTAVSSIKVERPKKSEPVDIIVTINHRYSYGYSFGRDVFRVFLARFAFLYHEKLDVEFMPYGNEFEMELPLDGSFLKFCYHVKYINTSREQMIEFTRINRTYQKEQPTARRCG